MNNKSLKLNINLDVPAGAQANKTLNKFIAAIGLSLTTVLTDQLDVSKPLVATIIAAAIIILVVVNKSVIIKK